MASVSTDANGNRRVTFKGLDEKRRAVYLGKVAERTANDIRRLVERILEAGAYGRAVDPRTATELGELADPMYEKLAAAGLVHPREQVEAATLSAFCNAYLARRTDLKGATLVFYSHTVENLSRFFGADARLDEITPADADDFRRWLQTVKASRQGRPLAVATINRRCVAARTIFRDALRRRLVSENPFAGIKAGTKSNSLRQRYVSPETVGAILDACPHDEWRLLTVLSRFAGLRIPSEALTLTWADIDWEHGRMTVHSPKTEHHEGKAQRTIPIFPEVLPWLQEVFEQAPEGATQVFSKLARVVEQSVNGWKAVNLRTTFLKIIKRAGAEPWPRLFHNMRASCQTDLEQAFPSYVVCAWLGNSESIAKAHYLQVLPEHFERAATTTRIPTRALPEVGRMGGNERSPKHDKTRISAGLSCSKLGDEGFEPPTSSL